MTTEATVRVTLNNGHGGEHGYVAVAYDSRAEMAPYLTLFPAQLLSERNSENSCALLVRELQNWPTDGSID